MVHIAILTCVDFPDLTEADRPLIRLLAEKNIQSSPIIWDAAAVDWHQFTHVLFRSVWDYFLKTDHFFKVLHDINEAGLICFNSLSTIEYNSHKYYLQDLQSEGIDIVPTLFLDKGSDLNKDIILSKNWEWLIIKPAISAGSYLTEKFHIDQLNDIKGKYREYMKVQDFMIQKYLPEIIDSGEISMVFFNGVFSHAVIKTPKSGDFRIQSQFGGTYKSYQMDSSLISVGQNILSKMQGDHLYARIDGVMSDGQFLLMEVELIEPDLYLDHVYDGQKRLVEAMISVI
ncbi:MAG: hypothetical protein WAU01_05125 [Saprospiraceae bacterium]